MKTIKSIFVLSFVVLMLSGCSAIGTPAEIQTSNAVQIPQALALAFGAFVLAGTTLGLQLVFDAVHIDFRGVAVPIASAITAAAIAQIQGWINLAPIGWDFWIDFGLKVALLLLTSFGYMRALLHPERARQLFAGITNAALLRH